MDNKILYWNGNNVSSGPDGPCNDYAVSLYDGTMAWVSCDYGQIMYWNGSSTRQLTDTENYPYANSPSLYNGAIAFTARSGLDSEIYYWDGSTIYQVTDNDVDDCCPSLHDGIITWHSWDEVDEDWEIYAAFITLENSFYIFKVTDNKTDDVFPSVHNSAVAWSGFDGNDYEIYFTDNPGTFESTQQITNNSTDDENPSLYNDEIAWRGFDGSDYEIYYAYACTNKVKFKGYVQNCEAPWSHYCGDYYVDVLVEEILWDPKDELTTYSSVRVFYRESKGLKPGDLIEVYATSFISVGPLGCLGAVSLWQEGDYLDKLEDGPSSTCWKRGMYVDRFDEILSSDTAKNFLRSFIRDHLITCLAIYANVSRLTDDQKQDLRTFVKKVREDNVDREMEIGTALGIHFNKDGSCDASKTINEMNTIITYNDRCEFEKERIDFVVTESEFWKENNFDGFLVGLKLISQLADDNLIDTAVYVGWPDEYQQADDIANEVDKIFIHSYVTYATDAYNYSQPRLEWFAKANSNIEIWPIFSAESPINWFMGCWLKKESDSFGNLYLAMKSAEDIFDADCKNDPNHCLRKPTGYIYFTYSQLINPTCGIFVDPSGECENKDSGDCYTSIQEALEKENSKGDHIEKGLRLDDIIKVKAGDYSEDVNFVDGRFHVLVIDGDWVSNFGGKSTSGTRIMSNSFNIKTEYSGFRNEEIFFRDVIFDPSVNSINCYFDASLKMGLPYEPYERAEDAEVIFKKGYKVIVTYKDSITIGKHVVFENGAEVIFDGGKSVIIEPGATFEKGARFHFKTSLPH